MDTLGLEGHRITRSRVGDYPEFVRALLQVKLSAAEVNRDAKTLGPESCERIQRAAAELMRGMDFAAFTADPYSGGGGVLINRQMNALLAEAAGVTSAEVNLGQSTADSCMSAARLALYRVLNPALMALEESVRLLKLNATKFADARSMSRTCLQDALPSTLGVLFEGYAELLARRKAALENVRGGLLAVNLGGTVIGSGEGASPYYRQHIVPALARVTGLAIVQRSNLYDAAQNCDDVASVASELELLARGLIKIAKDLRLLASGPEHGLGEIQLPKVISGSTFFSEKNNPTIPETLIQGAFLILGRTQVAREALAHAELNLNVFEFAGDFALYEAIEVLTRSLVALNSHCLPRITIANEVIP